MKLDADGTDQGGSESGEDDSAGSPRRRGHCNRPKSFDRKFPRKKIVFDTHCNCPDCGGELLELPPTVNEILKFIPVQYYVEVIIHRKRVCKKCRKLYQSSPLDRIFNKSRLSNEIIAEFAIGKFLHHGPLYQIQQLFKQEVTHVSYGTLLNHIRKLATRKDELYLMLLEVVRASSRLFANYTHLPMKGSEKLGRLISGHVWYFIKDDRSFGGTGPVIALLKGSPDWKPDTPAEILEGFDGILQVDTYRGWFKIAKDRKEKDQQIQLALCWVHDRLYFFKCFEFLKK